MLSLEAPVIVVIVAWGFMLTHVRRDSYYFHQNIYFIFLGGAIVGKCALSPRKI